MAQEQDNEIAEDEYLERMGATSEEARCLTCGDVAERILIEGEAYDKCEFCGNVEVERV